MSFTYSTPGTPVQDSLSATTVVFHWAPSNLLSVLNTVLLMHCNALPPVDSSGRGNVLANVSMSLDTSTPKFGAGDYFRIATSSSVRTCVTAPITAGAPLDILSGTGDFTIEGWVKVPFNGSPFIVCDYGSDQTTFSNSGGLVLSIDAPVSGGVRAVLQGGPTDSVSHSAWGLGSITLPALLPDTWYHWAIVRQAGAGQIFLNGQMGTMAGATWTNYPLQASSFFATGWTPIIIGGMGPGSVDEIQVTKGVARYTAPFTPPVAPFPDPGVSDAYIVFRDGAEFAQTFGGVVSFTDYGVPGDIHAYKVAAQDGVDNPTSDFSGILTVTFPAADGRASGKFAGAVAYPPFVLANAKGIIPKIYMPLEDVTARSKKK